MMRLSPEPDAVVLVRDRPLGHDGGLLDALRRQIGGDLRRGLQADESVGKHVRRDLERVDDVVVFGLGAEDEAAARAAAL